MRASLFFAIAAIVALVARSAAALELTELNERSRPAVVLVTIYDSGGHKLGTGSGFFVDATGRVVTNVHVIEDARRATVTVADGREIDVAGVLAQSPDDDVAVLQVTGGGAYPVLPLGESATLAVGQDVVVIGSPVGLSAALSTGVVAAIRDGGIPTEQRGPRAHFGESWAIQITAPISPGSSGSPVLARDGRVVASAVGMHAGGENVNFAVPIERAEALLRGLPVGAAPQPFAAGAYERSEVVHNLSISAAAFAAVGIAYVFWARRGKREGRGGSPRRAG
jgi:serine protease Do